MNVTDINISNFYARVIDARDKIAAVREDGKSIRVSIPVVYPNGNMAALEITPSDASAFITDMGLGHLESEYSGAEAYFDSQAKKAAERFGVSYDGYNLFAIEVPITNLESAMIAVANASVQAASNAIYRSIEDRSSASNDQVYERLLGVFGANSVEKSVEIKGLRETWPAHNVVVLNTGSTAIFEYVSSHQTSISNKFYMYSDLMNSEKTLSLNSVVENINSFNKAKGQLLADISHVVPIAAKNSQYERYAKMLNVA
ncbi:MAG: hypothetical protein ABJN98_23060 [Roseibium sp.]